MLASIEPAVCDGPARSTGLTFGARTLCGQADAPRTRSLPESVEAATPGRVGGISGGVGTMLMCGMDDPEVVPAETPVVDFEVFYASMWRDAARWATALVGDVATGEEVAQESFLQIVDRFEMLDSPVAYLRRTIVNTARMHARAASRRSAREQRIALAHATSSVGVSGASVELLEVLAGLSDDRRAAVVLRYWADWSDESIADALGCRPSTVRSHLRRGLIDLRAGLIERNAHG